MINFLFSYLVVRFRGKCHVSVLDDVRDNLPMYLDKENTFFYNYGYKPESR